MLQDGSTIDHHKQQRREEYGIDKGQRKFIRCFQQQSHSVSIGLLARLLNLSAQMDCQLLLVQSHTSVSGA